MGILYSKMHRIKKNKGKEAAKGETDTTHCPNCGNEAKLIEKHRDRATYQCTKCNAINTFTRPPTDYERKQKTKPKQSLIVIRDKSKEAKGASKGHKGQEESVPENGTIVPKNETTEELPRYTIDTIRKSLQHAKVLHFNYMDRNGQKSVRSIEPYKLERRANGDIVVWGYCLDNDGIRVFKINRIRKIKQLSYSFEPRWPIEDKLKDVK